MPVVPTARRKHPHRTRYAPLDVQQSQQPQQKAPTLGCSAAAAAGAVIIVTFLNLVDSSQGQQEEPTFVSSSLTTLSTQCIDEFVALNSNGTALDQLRLGLLNDVNATSTCTGPRPDRGSYNAITCVHDWRHVNASAYQALCSSSSFSSSHGNGNSSNTSNFNSHNSREHDDMATTRAATATTNSTTTVQNINASMIQYNMASECIRDPYYAYDVWMATPLCLPQSCRPNDNNITRHQVQELYNNHHAQPSSCSTAMIMWPLDENSDSDVDNSDGDTTCRTETLALSQIRVSRPILFNLLPFWDVVDSCLNAIEFNIDNDNCVKDYRPANVSDYQAICTALNGTMMRHDVTVTCTLDNGQVTSNVVLAEPRCMGPSCTTTIDALLVANYIPSLALQLYFDDNRIDQRCNVMVTEANMANGTLLPSGSSTTSSSLSTRVPLHWRATVAATIVVVIAAIWGTT